MQTFPLSPVIVLQELNGIQFIVNKWIERLQEGIPCITFEANDEEFEKYMKQLTGELRILSGKSDNLADVISGIR